MSNILVRTIWGAIFVGLMLGSFLLGVYSTIVILAIFMAIGLYEFYRFFEKNKEINPPKFIGVAGGLILFVGLSLSYTFPLELSPFVWIIPIIFLPLLHIVYSLNTNPILDTTTLIFSWIYILFPFYIMFLIYVHPTTSDFQWIHIIGFFVLVWANDTFAYLSGRFFGKHKLFERISPKKTWQGAIGGFIFAILFGILYATLFKQNYSFWICAASIISPTSIFGDLIESRFKRIVDVKDSGTLLRGHGGILDRFDAAMYAAPFFYLWMMVWMG